MNKERDLGLQEETAAFDLLKAWVRAKYEPAMKRLAELEKLDIQHLADLEEMDIQGLQDLKRALEETNANVKKTIEMLDDIQSTPSALRHMILEVAVVFISAIAVGGIIYHVLTVTSG